MIRGPQTTSTAASLYVSSMAEEQLESRNCHTRVEAPGTSVMPLMKQARRPGGRLGRKKRRASLKEEMKRLLRIQRIHEELYRMRTAGETEESYFESDISDREEDDR